MNTKLLGDFNIYINDGNYGGIYPEKELFQKSGIPFISASDFTGRIFNYNGIKFIGEDLHFKILKKGQLKINDIIIVVRGNGIGKVGFFKDHIGECNINAQLAFLRTDPEELDPVYLYYLLSSEKYLSLIKRFGSGSAQPQLPINRLKQVPITYSSLQTQQKIASILSALDSKIELNNRINAELEAMAKTLYNYWFVQFDFPDKNGKPYKTNGGKMVWNEELKREIPEGWGFGTTSELFSFNPSLSLKQGSLSSYIDMNSLPLEGFMTKDIRTKEFNGGVKFQNGDLVIARITPCLENGKTGLITLLNDNEIGFGSTEFIVLRGKKMKLSSFAACLSRSELFRKYAIAKMIGTSGRKRVDASALAAFLIAIPDEVLLEKFESTVSLYFEKMTIHTKENQQLSSLRDWLLPMLMNGQVTVGAKEKVDYQIKEEEIRMAAEPGGETKFMKN